MLKCYIINGSGGSGKDSFIDFIEAEILRREFKVFVVNHSTVDSVKEALAYLGLKMGDKSSKARKFISTVKNAWEEFNNGPNDEAVDLAKSLMEDVEFYNEDIYYFIHCREFYNIIELKDRIGKICSTKSLLIERLNHEAPDCDKDDPEFINKIKYDIHYIVDTKKDLIDSCINFIETEKF